MTKYKFTRLSHEQSLRDMTARWLRLARRDRPIEALLYWRSVNRRKARMAQDMNRRLFGEATA